MAVTHKRLMRENTVWTRVFCQILAVPSWASSWFWRYVTCKNCLKLRPKGKR